MTKAKMENLLKDIYLASRTAGLKKSEVTMTRRQIFRVISNKIFDAFEKDGDTTFLTGEVEE